MSIITTLVLREGSTIIHTKEAAATTITMAVTITIIRVMGMGDGTSKVATTITITITTTIITSIRAMGDLEDIHTKAETTST